MKMKVCELTGKSELESAMQFVFKNFTESEKKFYEKPEFLYARKSLVTYDVFNIEELEHYVSSCLVKLFAVFSGETMIGVSALKLEGGKILFFSLLQSAEGKEAGRQLIERMVEELENMPDKRLNILAFVGQEKTLVSLGFIRTNSSVFKFFGIKFIAMRYDYAQIDIER